MFRALRGLFAEDFEQEGPCPCGYVCHACAIYNLASKNYLKVLTRPSGPSPE